MKVDIKRLNKVVNVRNTNTYFAEADCDGGRCDEEIEIIENTHSNDLYIKFGSEIYKRIEDTD